MNITTQSGNLGQNAELFKTQNGGSILNFNIPTKSGYGDNEKVVWVKCKLFGKRADALAPILLKGVKVVVSGQMTLENWEKDGKTNAQIVILLNDIDIMSSVQKTENNQTEYKRVEEVKQEFTQAIEDAVNDDIPF